MTNTLIDLLQYLHIDVKIDNNINIAGIENDSRNVKDNYVFVAVKGYKSDGHRFVKSAVEKGACCIFVEQEEYAAISASVKSIPVIPYQNTRKALALISKYFYDDPSQKLTLIGVTGTNGKTSITYIIRQILMQAGKKVGLIGTICSYIGDTSIPNPVTTPESLEINRLLHKMVLAGIEYAVMEVSSHALYLDRVTGLEFDCIGFTNLSVDHLDFHNDMQEYLRAKELMFEVLEQSRKQNKIAVLNKDLDISTRLCEKATQHNLNYLTFAMVNQADYQGISPEYSLSHSQFIIKNQVDEISVCVNLPGKFNVYNTLTSYAILKFLQIDLSSILSGLKNVSVPGRFQLIKSPNGAFVIIDYAHTNDALKNVLTAIKELNPNHIYSVFGAGGDRDKGKRPLMGEEAGIVSDLSIVTSDNPRSEEPEMILDDIVVGVKKTGGDYIKIVDRYQAIKKAVELSEQGDIILIAGKGHEDYQIFKDKTIHFDDKEAAMKAFGEVYGTTTT